MFLLGLWKINIFFIQTKFVMWLCAQAPLRPPDSAWTASQVVWSLVVTIKRPVRRSAWSIKRFIFIEMWKFHLWAWNASLSSILIVLARPGRRTGRLMAESKLQTPCAVVQALLGGHRGAWARSHVTNLGCMLKISYFSESQKEAGSQKCGSEPSTMCRIWI